MKGREGTLTYNPSSGRMCIAYPTYRDDLHCGDSFEIYHEDRWVQTSIEMLWPEKTWFLTGLPGVDMIGARVRT